MSFEDKVLAALEVADRLAPAEAMLREAAERCERFSHLRDGAMACAPCLARLVTELLVARF